MDLSSWYQEYWKNVSVGKNVKVMSTEKFKVGCFSLVANEVFIKQKTNNEF